MSKLAELQNTVTRLRRTRDYVRQRLGEATRTMARLTDEVVAVEEMIEHAENELHEETKASAS